MTIMIVVIINQKQCLQHAKFGIVICQVCLMDHMMKLYVKNKGSMLEESNWRLKN